MTARKSLRDWADLLRKNWEERSKSPDRDFYVASHAGWNDAVAWAKRAESDLNMMLYQIDQMSMRAWEVLEIGCGVGRLAPPTRRRAQGYTGFDISAGMVEEARRRCHWLASARFFVGDGLTVPEEATDRRYNLILCLAVFIHCPRPVVESTLRSAVPLLADGGEIRFQLLANPEDPTGVASVELAAEQHAEMMNIEEEVTPRQRELIDGHYYIGHAFRFEEAEELVAGLADAETMLLRPDLAHIYGITRWR